MILLSCKYFKNIIKLCLEHNYNRQYVLCVHVANFPDIPDDVSDAPDFSFNDISTEFVRKELSSLHLSKSSGLKDIHTCFLKVGVNVLAYPLTYVFNRSLHSCEIPNYNRNVLLFF